MRMSGDLMMGNPPFFCVHLPGVGTLPKPCGIFLSEFFLPPRISKDMHSRQSIDCPSIPPTTMKMLPFYLNRVSWIPGAGAN
jgi:hypothetical protein